MAITISSFDEVSNLVRHNPLRNYPNLKKGYDRLFPVPRPRMAVSRSLSPDARFFCIGACFARGMERALKAAGRTVLSSRTGLGLPGSIEDQFNRYNVFNLDVGLNEVRWSLGIHDAPADAPLVKLGNDFTDLQLHWAFAHPEDEARRFRKLYNDSFASIVEADVVVLTAAGIRQWFDRERQIYINSMPPAGMIKVYPDRFEMHEFDVEGATARLRDIVHTLKDNLPRNPLILLGVAPVWQPISLSAQDALVDQMKVKAMQRVAVETICNEFENVDYLPALENALLGDFIHGYMNKSPNHTGPNLAERVVADMLEDYGATDFAHRLMSARAHAEAALTAGDAKGAMALCEPLRDVVKNDHQFRRFYLTVLSKAGRATDATTFLLDLIDQGGVDDPAQLWDEAVKYLKPTDVPLINRLREVGRVIKADEALLDLRIARPSNPEIEISRGFSLLAKLREKDDLPEALNVLAQMEQHRPSMARKSRDRFDVTKMQTTAKAVGERIAIEAALTLLKTDQDPSALIFRQISVLASKVQSTDLLPVIDTIEAFAADAFNPEERSEGDVHAGLERLKETRRKIVRRIDMRSAAPEPQ